MRLTISMGVYECENWEYHLNRILNQINTLFTNYHELLLIDDRHDQSIPLENFITNSDVKYKIIAHGTNKKCLAVRLTALNNCTGDYIWLIDMDDDVLKFDFDTIKSYDSDIIFFSKYNYDLRPDKKLNKGMDYEPFYMRNELFIINNFRKFDYLSFNIKSIDERKYFLIHYNDAMCTYWSKIINVEFFKKCVNLIDLTKFTDLRYSDDVLMNLYFFNNITKVMIVNVTQPYVYRIVDKTKYLPEIDGVPNTKIETKIIDSWKCVINYSEPSELKDAWVKNLKAKYKGIDFSKYGL